MSVPGADVVIVGAGIVGVGTAYYLARAGVRSVVVEKDAVASHASGFAYGGLSPLSGFGIPGPLAEMAQEGIRAHRELAQALPAETGIDVEFRSRSSLALALTDADVERLRAAMVWQQQQKGYTVRWLGPDEARAIEPRISDKTLGAAHIEGGGDVEPYKLVLALTHAAERLGVSIRQGRVVGLRREGDKATGVVLERGEISCSAVVLAGGPWIGEAGAWLGVPIPVRPLKGQILRLRAPGPPVPCSVGWGHNYATTKPDGLLWAGTTEEEAGFDEETTVEARDRISEALLTMLPPMIDAEIVYQTACLRPLSADGLLLLGRAPDLDNVYVATGGARKGILYGPPMARTIADLVTTNHTALNLAPFSPARFATGVTS